MRTLGKYLLPFAMLAMFMPVAQADVDIEMTARLQALYPKTKFQQVNKTPAAGLTEVIMGQNVAYVDITGRYFMFGKLYDMKTQQDLTANRLEEIQKIDMAKLDTELAIKRVHGDGSRTLYLFSDPDCPFCKQLEKSLAKVENVTIYTFMMPLTSLHPDAHKKAVSTWCASNRAAAWDDMMLRNKEPKSASCDNPIDKVLALANSLSINGTPTMFNPDGRKMAGARDTEVISKWLDEGGSKKLAHKE